MVQAAEIDRRVDQGSASDRARARARILRPMLMLGGTVVLLIGALLWWLNSGRWVSIDDSYGRAAKLTLSTDISGVIETVDVHEGQAVRSGQTLFTLNPRPFRIALAGALAARSQTLLDVQAMKQDEQRLLHETQMRQAQLQGDQASYDRVAPLVRGGAATREEADDARYKLASDRQEVEALRVQALEGLARLGGNADIDPTQTPAYLTAEARVDEAQRQLDHTVVRAPFDGVATQVEQLQPGQYLAAASAAFGLVSSDNVWVEGNPKETQLTWVKPGDRARIAFDTYPGRVFAGVVESIAPATGSEFSLLPAQNTTGNWVKVTQRIPVRVRIERRSGDPPVRAGMSAMLSIDTGHVRSLRHLF